LAARLGLPAQNPDPAPRVAPAVPQGNCPAGTALYLKVYNAKDEDGKDIPYSKLFDLKADQVSLNQAWAAFLEHSQATTPCGSAESWAALDARIAGPRVNLDLKGATPGEVLAVLNRLARQKGVPAYEVPGPAELPNFSITKYVRKDGETVLDLHARQVSFAFLDTLMSGAQGMVLDSGLVSSTSTFTRSSDHGTGPKVDALFEGLTLKDLQAKVQRLKAEEAGR